MGNFLNGCREQPSETTLENSIVSPRASLARYDPTYRRKSTRRIYEKASTWSTYDKEINDMKYEKYYSV